MKKLFLLLLLIPVLSWAEPSIEELFEALEGAHAAGNKEDARKLANYIRQLQQQQINKGFKPSKAVSDCYISVAESAKTTLGSAIGAHGCRLKHSNSFFSSERQLGKCLISIAKSAKTISAASLGRMGCNNKYRN